MEASVEFEIRIVDVDPMDAFRAYLERRIRFALGRFSRSIRRVTVRGGATREDCDSEVAITMNLIPKGRAVIVERAGDAHRAIDRGSRRWDGRWQGVWSVIASMPPRRGKGSR